MTAPVTREADGVTRDESGMSGTQFGCGARSRRCARAGALGDLTIMDDPAALLQIRDRVLGKT